MYPEDWEGIVSCQVQVGSCHMWGKGLEIVETRNNNTGNIPFLKLYILFPKQPFDICYFRWNYQIFPFMFTTSLFSHAFCLSTFVSFASQYSDFRSQRLHESRKRRKKIQRRRHKYRTPRRSRRTRHRVSSVKSFQA